MGPVLRVIVSVNNPVPNPVPDNGNNGNDSNNRSHYTSLYRYLVRSWMVACGYYSARESTSTRNAVIFILLKWWKETLMFVVIVHRSYDIIFLHSTDLDGTTHGQNFRDLSSHKLTTA